MQGEFRFYLLGQEAISPLTKDQLQTEGPKVGYVKLEGLRSLGEQLGFADKLGRDFGSEPARLRNSIDVYDNCSIGDIVIINLSNQDAARDRIALILMKDLFLLAEVEDQDNSVQAMFEETVQRFKNGATMEKFICGILDRMLLGGSQMLEDTEAKMLKLERSLLSDRANRSLSRTIYTLRRWLSLCHNYLEQLIDLAQVLQVDENSLLTPGNKYSFGLFIGRAERLSGSVKDMIDTSVHLRESLEAVTNYNMNHDMKILTVITAVFLPLTLIVGWYGMNFKYMPELNWPLAYPALFVISVVLVAVILIFFRRKHFL